MANDPRSEADARLGGRYDVRVLEPSPPAVLDPPWFADDPVARDPGDGRPIVSPVATGDVRWARLASDDPDLAQWCAERWLAAHPRLAPPPDTLASTRIALHAVADQVLAPARRRAPGAKIGLRWTRGGFGTPFFGDDEQLRVVGDVLIHQRGTQERSAPLRTLRDAAELAGVEVHAAASRPLEIDPGAARWLGDLYGFAASVLEELRAEAEAGDQPSRVQLWPEHFDMSVELGDEAAGHRATFGVSPGDDAHGAPYVYVAPWTATPPDPAIWNAKAFAGAELSLEELLHAPDQRERALEFLRLRRAALSVAGSR